MDKKHGVNTSRRLLAGLLALALLLGMLPLVSVAAPDPDGFDITGGVLTGYTGTDSLVKVPSGVTRIGDQAFKGNLAIKTLTLPAGLTAIGSDAFKDCANLVKVVVFGTAAMTIGAGAFDGGVEFVAENANVRTSLSNYGVPAVNIKSAQYEIVNNVLTKCNLGLAAEVYNVTNTVMEIGDGAFKGCENLTFISMPLDLKTIGESAFEGCEKLGVAPIPAGVTEIKANAFKGCAALTKLVVSSRALAVGANAFESGMLFLVFNDSVKAELAAKTTGCTVRNFFDDMSTVKFEPNGGSFVADITNVDKRGGGTRIGKPTSRRDNYALEGWYKDVGLTQKHDFDTDKIIADTTLYAKWTGPLSDAQKRVPLNLQSPREARTHDTVTLLWDKPYGIYDLIGEDFEEYAVFKDGVQIPGTIGWTDGDDDPSIGANTMGYAVKGLSPGTEYTFTVRTKYKGILSDASNAVTVRTKPAPAVIIDVTKAPYNALGDGIAKDTAAIQAAIDACPAGGVVWLPGPKQGKIYLCGALFLKSNMTLQVDGELRGSLDLADYPVIESTWEGTLVRNYASLITMGAIKFDDYDYWKELPTTFSVRDVTVCGSGRIDGRGYLTDAESLEVWGPVDGAPSGARYRIGLMALQRNGPNLNLDLGQTGSDHRSRGRCIMILNAEDIYIRDLDVFRGAAWTIHAAFSNHITFDNLNIISKTAGSGSPEMRVTNGDGIDPDSSSNINIFKLKFYGGDDPVACKAGKNLEGYLRNKPTYNIRATNCYSENSNGGYIVGSEQSGGVYNVLFQDINANVAQSRVYETRASEVRGGYAKNLSYIDCTTSGPRNSLSANLSYSGNNDTPPAPLPPVFQNIYCENVVGIGGNNTGIPSKTFEIVGLPNSPISYITVKNSYFTSDAYENTGALVDKAYMRYADHITIENTAVNGVAPGGGGIAWDFLDCDRSTIVGIPEKNITGYHPNMLQGDGSYLFQGQDCEKRFMPLNVNPIFAANASAGGGVYWLTNSMPATTSLVPEKYVEFILPVLPQGEYEVIYGYRRVSTMATVQPAFDGAAFGNQVALGGSSGFVSVNLGSVEVTGHSKHALRLNIAPDTSSRGTDYFNCDYIRLIPLNAKQYSLSIAPVVKLAAGYAANIPVVSDAQYVVIAAPGGGDNNRAEITEGGAMLKLAKAVPGRYEITAYVGGVTVSGIVLDCVDLPADIWRATARRSGGRLEVSFNEDIVLRSETGCVTVGGVAYNARVLGDKRTVEVLGIDAATLPGASALTIAGVKYPDLFPSYSFTFSVAVP